jgi:hypothetical protein
MALSQRHQSFKTLAPVRQNETSREGVHPDDEGRDLGRRLRPPLPLLPSYFLATSSRYQRRIVSGEAMVAIAASPFQPNACPVEVFSCAEEQLMSGRPLNR